MSMAETSKTNEKRGRKNIATLLSLMDFHDDNLDTTIKTMREKLRGIKEKELVAAQVLLKPSDGINFNFPVIQQDYEAAVVAHDDNTEVDSINVSSSSENPLLLPCSINIPTGLNAFIRSIGGSEPELMMAKSLSKSDVTCAQGRLLIPASTLTKNLGFLTSDEKRRLRSNENISVWVFDLERRKSTMNLKKWGQDKKLYALVKEWSKLVSTNRLKADMMLQIWSFRVSTDQQLCFALVHVEDI